MGCEDRPASSIVAISGSPRRDGNTELLLRRVLEVTGGQLVRVCDLDIAPCASCWYCLEHECCAIDDDMTELSEHLLRADAVILGSPVYFNNVSAQLKAVLDRTWSLRGRLTDKIGGAVVAGRGYGSEGAVAAINALFLKHNMIPANRGVSAQAFALGDAQRSEQAIADCEELGRRIVHLVHASRQRRREL